MTLRLKRTNVNLTPDFAEIRRDAEKDPYKTSVYKMYDLETTQLYQFCVVNPILILIRSLKTQWLTKPVVDRPSKKCLRSCSLLHTSNDSRNSEWSNKDKRKNALSRGLKQHGQLSHKSSVGLVPFQTALLYPLIGSVSVESRSEKLEHRFHVNSDDLVFTLFNIGKHRC